MQSQNLKPDAWMVPHLVTFKDVLSTDCPVDLQGTLEGTVSWSPSLLGDAPPVVDKYGVTHRPQPLYRVPPGFAIVRLEAESPSAPMHGDVVWKWGDIPGKDR